MEVVAGWWRFPRRSGEAGAPVCIKGQHDHDWCFGALIGGPHCAMPSEMNQRADGPWATESAAPVHVERFFRAATGTPASVGRTKKRTENEPAKTQQMQQTQQTQQTEQTQQTQQSNRIPLL
ncbi:uncharacterized protein UV8b_06959 [Ustilaginoidea virens]|uniref:Uncharacterized protein n=1 Tax=Ustilaginoidea virens TaxID=1159556 RepID=A0A8E5HWP8_USTVR|nr:uncharacterized protein UV8b_06959 [Ustilaginoidea virens]QUC22718.1 hypothetical protein UV8b_06959 [Ustilaginoidea virens]